MDSRIEQLLEALLSGQTVDITPQSRNEAYLLAMINGDTDVPEPRTRAEAYFYALAKNGAGGGGGEPGGADHTNEDGLITGTLTEYTNDRVEQIRESLFEGFPLTKITLNNVVDCQQYAFEKCAELKEVNMPNLERFGSSCFYGCTSLEYINFPKLTSRLNSPNQTSEFYNCTSLKQCLIPNYGAALCSMFNGCSNLELVEVGGIGLNASSSYAKAFNNCAKLTTLIFRSATMIALPNMSHFNGTPFASGGTGGTVYVPAALIEQYQTATNWSTLYTAGTCNFVAIEGSEYE